MAWVSLYKRILPSPPAIELAATQGKKLFEEALQNGTVEGFFKLHSSCQTQSEFAFCGLASLSMVFNALAIEPPRLHKGAWRWWDDSMFECWVPLEKVMGKGLPFKKAVSVARCAGGNVEAFYSNKSSIDDFRKCVMSCTSNDKSHMITSYHRPTLSQTGRGHYSPIGGYHAGRDMVLILDVARFKYPSHWIPLTLLWKAMNTIDGTTRGFMIISKLPKTPSLLNIWSCRYESWLDVANYLMDDVPVNLQSSNVTNVQEVLSLIVTSFPTSFAEIIKWIELRGHTGPEIKVLKQVRETELFKHMIMVDRSQIWREVQTIFLLSLPPQTWSGIKDENLLQEIYSLFSLDDLPHLLREEVLNLRGELDRLKICQKEKYNNLSD
ncbi:hypothetical protein MKW98_001455 [Papaver atlanticum]|uniref:glutathione gamma-glutamylcysteinyltransferase n=1 Tax=Papaver atlanticum TaxID=357466 RepID=A0AAD4SXG4_9MAGN|nr:hypothetical protein MKW98_001455 [Papaver atlanticum]